MYNVFIEYNIFSIIRLNGVKIMTVYADVLVVLNLIVDYFLLSLSAHILKKSISVLRIILSALIGAFSSLYIFLPKMSPVVETFLKISACMLMCLAAFGYLQLKSFLRAFFVVTSVSFLYGGFMIAVWYIFKPSGMIINNSVVYFNVSPVFLILFSVVAYLTIIFARKITERNAVYSKSCNIDLISDKNITSIKGIVDTGNSVEDMFCLSEIIVVDESVAKSVFNGYPFSDSLKHRYRVLPMNTVSGTTLLDGYRCDKALVSFEGKEIELKSPVLAISKTPLKDGFEAIVNPKIFE